MVEKRQAGGFSRHKRLKRPDEYRQVFQSACRSADGCLLVLARQNGFQHARLGLAISRKNIRLAVQRNRLKRLIRESFRLHQQELSGLDVVVVSHKPLTRIDSPVLNRLLRAHWQKVRQCKKY